MDAPVKVDCALVGCPMIHVTNTATCAHCLQRLTVDGRGGITFSVITLDEAVALLDKA